MIDDGIVYRISAEYYYLIINASNEDKDWNWLTAVNDGVVILDPDRPWIKVEAPALLRNLKDPKSGKDQKRDIALQGPASLPTLQAMTDDPVVKKKLAMLRRTALMSCELSGIPLVIARTGYTGENWGFEILVHPDQMVKLWNTILEVGGPLGVKPAGLACRDSTRIEAGLPLYGHELEGPLSVTPVEAGFPGYVKYHKPFFVGRDALLAREKDRVRELVRFRCNLKRTRRPNTLDPVVDDHGAEVGQVTSCSVDVSGYLVGLALVNKRCCQDGYSLRIFPLQGKTLEEGLLTKNKVTLPVEVTVLSRFPEKDGQKPRWMMGED